MVGHSMSQYPYTAFHLKFLNLQILFFYFYYYYFSYVYILSFHSHEAVVLTSFWPTFDARSLNVITTPYVTWESRAVFTYITNVDIQVRAVQCVEGKVLKMEVTPTIVETKTIQTCEHLSILRHRLSPADVVSNNQFIFGRFRCWFVWHVWIFMWSHCAILYILHTLSRSTYFLT